VAAAGDFVHLEALRLQPGGYFGDITDCEAEAVAELFGGKPLAVTGRSGKLLFRQECVKCRRRLERRVAWRMGMAGSTGP